MTAPNSALTRHWPPAEAKGQPGTAASERGHHASPVPEAYPTAGWRTWPEVEVTVNGLLPADPCGWCAAPGAVTAVRVHFQDIGPRDVCVGCADDGVVQDAVTWNPDNHITQVETAS